MNDFGVGACEPSCFWFAVVFESINYQDHHELMGRRYLRFRKRVEKVWGDEGWTDEWNHERLTHTHPPPYHQGMGYLTGFLLILVPPDDVCKMLHCIGRDDKYTPGYWKGQPEAFVRDAMVYLQLVRTRFPAVAAQVGGLEEEREVGWKGGYFLISCMYIHVCMCIYMFVYFHVYFYACIS